MFIALTSYYNNISLQLPVRDNFGHLLIGGLMTIIISVIQKIDSLPDLFWQGIILISYLD